MKLEIVDTNHDCASISLDGRLDAHHAIALREIFARLETQGIRRFDVSMPKVEFMDSSGLAAIISGLKAARKAGGELTLIEPSQAVRQVLHYTLLDRVIPIKATSKVVIGGRSA
jgi:anti-sigma B factor antagonist